MGLRSDKRITAAIAILAAQVAIFVCAGIYRQRAWAHEEDLHTQFRAARLRGDAGEERNLRTQIDLISVHRDLQSLRDVMELYRDKYGKYPPAFIPHLIPPYIGTHRGLDLPHDPFGPPIAQNYEYHADLGGWIKRYPKSDAWFSSDRFAKLDGSPIDPALITGTRIDRFEFTDREFYGYASNGKRFIVFGVGPDGDTDSTTETREAYLRSGDRRALVPFTYDPTNGVQSSGDIFLTDVD